MPEDLKPITLTTLEAALAAQALAGLDGFNKIENGKAVFVPFKFTDAVRTKIRRWKRALKVVADDYQDAQLEIIKELSPENQDIAQEPATVRAAFNKRVLVLQKVTYDFVLERLTLNGDLFNDGKNPIPDTVLDAIDKLIIDTPEPAKPETEGGE